MRTITEDEARLELERQTKNVSEADLEKVLDKREEIEKKFTSNGPLGRFITDLKLLFSLLNDYSKKRYRAVPWWTIAAIVVALLYVLNPIAHAGVKIPLSPKL